MTTHAPCTAGARCRSYTPGHLVHQIHVNQLRQAPEGWRDAVVVSIDEHNVAALDYDTGEGTCTLWHHHDLSVMCPPGTAVMVHERWHVLAVGRVVVNVHVHDGVGPVPPTAARSLPAAIITELATGHGVMVS